MLALGGLTGLFKDKKGVCRYGKVNGNYCLGFQGLGLRGRGICSPTMEKQLERLQNMKWSVGSYSRL